MRSRPGETSQESGRRFERFWAKIFGTDPNVGSGNKWFVKLDVGDGSITWECKWTKHRSYALSKDELRSCEEAVYKNGDNSIPGMAIAIDGGEDVVVVLKASDFLRLMASDHARYITPTKADQKRRRASTPTLLRDDDAA